jgi:hypothetical protein
MNALSAQAIIEATLPKVCSSSAPSRTHTHQVHRGVNALGLPPIWKVGRQETLRVHLLRRGILHPYLRKQ